MTAAPERPARLRQLWGSAPAGQPHASDTTRWDAIAITDRLTQEGLSSATGKPLTGAMIQWIRYVHRIPLPPPPPDTLTVKEVSRRYGVSAGVVYYWIEHGLVPAHRRRPGCPYAITLDATTDAALRQRAATVKRPASTNSPNPS